MFRTGFVLAFHLILILIMFPLTDSTISKRLQKCRLYNALVYGETIPTCQTSIGSRQAISIEEFPHIAVFGFWHNNEKNYAWLCHGALVSSRYVLSVGHCLRKRDGLVMKVRLGATSIYYTDESKSTDYDVEQIILHPNFTSSSFYNDIGFVKLSRQVEFSERVRPICLPDTDVYSDRIYQVNYVSSQEQKTDPGPLTKYELIYITNEKCNEPFTGGNVIDRKLRYGFTDALMCIQKSLNDSAYYNCAGESGAPLYIDHPEVACSHIQLGIESFGYGCFSGILEGGTRVYNFVDWIESVIWADE